MGFLELEHKSRGLAPPLQHSLYLNRPVQVYWFEHYAEFLHCLTGCTAPIHNACGESVGALVVSGCQEAVHPRALDLTASTARALEERLKSLEERDFLEVLKKFNRYLLKFPDSPILALCPHGHILALSQAMAKAVTLQSPERLIGQRLQDVQDLQVTGLFPSFSSAKSAEPCEISLSLLNKGKVGSGTVVPVLSPQGQQAGFIVVASGLGSPPAKRLLKQSWQATHTVRDLVGCSSAFCRVLRLAEKAATQDWPVLLVGESGTGKGLFAQSIHSASRCADGPFVTLNCGMIPKELVASELFGYEEGAFSGALRGGKTGKIALAHGGTLFLDEVEDMPPETQMGLLHFLEEGYIVPLGGERPQRMNVRVIAATNVEPTAAVAQGKLRLDLYHRLNVFPIFLPPLRERREDIPLLVRYLLQREGFAEVEVHPEAMAVLQQHPWPGNVRELRNVLIRAATLAVNRVITRDDLPSELLTLHSSGSLQTTSSHCGDAERIRQAFQKCKGNVSRAAKLLGIHRSTLYYKLREYGLSNGSRDK
jgi:transcriptional regulator with PAS, ATPase and Fis domain